MILWVYSMDNMTGKLPVDIKDDIESLTRFAYDYYFYFDHEGIDFDKTRKVRFDYFDYWRNSFHFKVEFTRIPDPDALQFGGIERRCLCLELSKDSDFNHPVGLNREGKLIEVPKYHFATNKDELPPPIKLNKSIRCENVPFEPIKRVYLNIDEIKAVKKELPHDRSDIKS